MRGDPSQRRLRYLVVAITLLLAIVPIPLIAVLTLVFLAGGIILWPNEPPPPPSPWTVPFAVLLGLNLVALVTFAVRSRSYGWWLLAAAQAADLVVVLVTIASTLPWLPYYVCLACGIVVLVLLLLLRFAEALQV